MPQSLANRLFNKLEIQADFELSCPSGGTLSVRTDQQQTLLVQCSDEDALWDSFNLLNAIGFSSSVIRIGLLRNPLPQPLRVFIGDRVFVDWQPGSRPSLKSLRLLFNWLRSR